MKKIIIVTKKWGRNFTGATLATQCLVEQWVKKVDAVEVLTLICGDYSKLSWIPVRVCRNNRELKKIAAEIWKQKKEGLFFYSDDHLGYILAEIGVPYFHTYHGNWPDAKYINVQMFFKSFYFIPVYKKTLRGAEKVINVSRYMEKFTLKYNKKSAIIHNGIDHKIADNSLLYPKTIVMVGNIDERKYKYAIKVAEYLMEIAPEIKIHIYGKDIDKRLSGVLSTKKNIVLKGQQNSIPYRAYSGLMNTSSMENLSISVCEAIVNQIPVFCFEVGGLPEVVLNEKTGFVIKRFDVKLMAETIAANLHREKMKIETDILSDFKWDYAAQEYLKIFEKEVY